MDALRLPVFCSVICAVPPKTPGATFVSAKRLLQPELMLLLEAPPIEVQAVSEFTWLVKVSVPEERVSFGLDVSAVKPAKVPAPPKYAAIPIAISSMRIAFVGAKRLRGRAVAVGCGAAAAGSGSAGRGRPRGPAGPIVVSLSV